MNGLQDKAIVVTGAGGAMAGHIEDAFQREGARLILVDRDEVRIASRARSFGTRPIVEDLLTRESAERAARGALDHMGRIDGLIHLVGDLIPGRLETTSDEAYRHVFESNVRTLFLTTRAFLPALKARQESFIASLGAPPAFHDPLSEQGVFSAAKGAATALLRALDAELNGTGVTVSIVTPHGPVDTPTGRKLMPDPGPGGWIDPSRIARAFVHAASGDAGGRQVEIPIHPGR